ncbi:MAG: hypothetical protein M3O94_04545, partial [Actinomycetota bacterium]|nr:hypothetical protein [Actinomycetota bacterium]
GRSENSRWDGEEGSGWDFARQVADRIVYLDEGAVVEDGAPEDVFTAPSDPRTARFLARYMNG